jgi:hypothetical protein
VQAPQHGDLPHEERSSEHLNFHDLQLQKHGRQSNASMSTAVERGGRDALSMVLSAANEVFFSALSSRPSLDAVLCPILDRSEGS